MKCKEQSYKLNCGCCDDVVLRCDYKEGHSGAHQFIIEDYRSTRYHVRWFKDAEGSEK